MKVGRGDGGRGEEEKTPTNLYFIAPAEKKTSKRGKRDEIYVKIISSSSSPLPSNTHTHTHTHTNTHTHPHWLFGIYTPMYTYNHGIWPKWKGEEIVGEGGREGGGRRRRRRSVQTRMSQNVSD